MRSKNFEISTQQEFLNKNDLINALNLSDKDGINHLIKYAYILHDKDVYTKQDELNNKTHKQGTKKPAHWHILIVMDNTYTDKYIANRFNVPIQFVQKIKSKFSNALNYLTHNTSAAKNEQKYLYDDNEVYSNYCWKNERQKAIDNENKKSRKSEIINSIINGEIREYNYTNHISGTEYTLFKKEIDLAFKYRKDSIKGAERTMECIFINGTSGSGKTTYAKEYAKKLGYSYYVSSGSNDVLDDYAGQDCIILDDLRPSCIGLSDLLKMLDNNTASTVKSRYQNKVLECKLIIITTICNIDEFFKNVFEAEKEPIKQLKRRCKTRIRMIDNKIYISLYDDKLGDYGVEISAQNDILKKYTIQSFNSSEDYENEAKKFILNLDE